MKFIIIYNDTLRSKIIYSKFINDFHKDIICGIKIPALTKKKSGKTSIFLLKKLLNANIKLVLFHIFQIILYQIIGMIRSSSLDKIISKKGIKKFHLKKFPDSLFLKNIIKENKLINENEIIIFASTTTILKKDNLKDNIILNFHEGPEEYKGSAIFYHLALNKEKYFYTMITQPDLGIDTGEIVLKSKKILIENFSVFEIFLSGVYLQSKLIYEILNLKIKKNSYLEEKSASEAYSYPPRNINKILKKNNIKDINFNDFIKIIKLSYINEIDELYEYILKIINGTKK